MLHRILIGLALGALTLAAIAPQTVADTNNGALPYYYHDAAYNVTANGTYQLVLDGTETYCDITYTIVKGETLTDYAEIRPSLSLLPDCRPLLSINNVTTAVLGGPTAGTYRIQVIGSTSHANRLTLEAYYYWGGTIEEGPQPVLLQATAQSGPWWVRCPDCPWTYWNDLNDGYYDYEIGAFAHSHWAGMFQLYRYQDIDMDLDIILGYPKGLTCTGRTNLDNGQWYGLPVECGYTWYPPT